jgi:hypothetical protein
VVEAGQIVILTKKYNKIKEKFIMKHYYEDGGKVVKFYTAPRNGQTVKKITKPEAEWSIKSDIDNREKITAADMENTIAKLLNIGDPAKVAAALCFTAACFLKPHFTATDRPFQNLIIEDRSGRAGMVFGKVIKALFSTEASIDAQVITDTRFMHRCSSSDYVPVLIENYNNAKCGKWQRIAIINGLRSLFNMTYSPVAQGDLSIRNYYHTAPGILLCDEKPYDRGLWRRSIVVNFDDCRICGTKSGFKEFVLNPETERGLGGIGKLLLETSKQFTAEEIYRLASRTEQEFKAKYKGFDEAFRLSLLSMGLWLIEQAADSLDTTIEECFGISYLQLEDKIFSAVLLPEANS